MTAVVATHVRHFVRQHSANFMQNIHRRRRRHTCNGTAREKKAKREIKTKSVERLTHSTHVDVDAFLCFFFWFIMKIKMPCCAVLWH